MMLFCLVYALCGLAVTMVCSRKWPKVWVSPPEPRFLYYESRDIPLWPFGFAAWPVVLLVLSLMVTHRFLKWYATAPELANPESED